MKIVVEIPNFVDETLASLATGTGFNFIYDPTKTTYIPANTPLKDESENAGFYVTWTETKNVSLVLIQSGGIIFWTPLKKPAVHIDKLMIKFAEYLTFVNPAIKLVGMLTVTTND